MDSPQQRQNLGKKLRAARLKKKLTQAQVAKLAELNTNYYACVERGEENISFNGISRLEKVLDIKLLNI